MLRLASAATRVVDALAIASFTGMFLCVLAQVVLRYVFDRPLVWSDELARYLFVWCAFLGWIVAARRRSHLAIGVLADRCGPRGRALFALAASAAAVIFSAVLFAYGIQITTRNLDIGTVALFFSFGFVYAIVPIAALAVGIYAIADAIVALQLFRTAAPR
ncbi:MAG TPA: TRAP transporter small permease [Casimicrobiaceae bacterium]|jgi:TRAP-type C4-dicarboxylate transport system permease small subunit